MSAKYIIGCETCGTFDIYTLGRDASGRQKDSEFEEQAKNGDLGVAMRRLTEHHPEGEFRSEKSLYVCKCGKIKEDWATMYFYRNENDDKADKFRSLPRKCPECLRNMKRYTEYERKNIICPVCGSKMVARPAKIEEWL